MSYNNLIYLTTGAFETLTNLDCNVESVRAAVAVHIASLSEAPADDLLLFERGRCQRAILLYRTADGASAPAESLLATATALELLELGLTKHFKQAEPPVYGLTPANLALITADRYYAKALALVVDLRDDRLVRILCDALAEASESYSQGQLNGSSGRPGALAQAASHLGCLLGGQRDYQEASINDIDRGGQ